MKDLPQSSKTTKQAIASSKLPSKRKADLLGTSHVPQVPAFAEASIIKTAEPLKQHTTISAKSKEIVKRDSKVTTGTLMRDSKEHLMMKKEGGARNMSKSTKSVFS